MRSITMMFSCLCLVALGSVATAIDKENAPDDSQAMIEMYKQLATPGEPHKLLANLAGNWTTTTKSWMDPGKPPMESTGTAVMKMVLGGRFLLQEFTSEMMGQPFSGIGIDGYDNLRQKYVTAWFDTMGTGIFLMEGSASPDGKTITLEGQHDEPGGGSMSHRAVWKLVDENTQTFDMYGAHHGAKEMKMMEITYTRKP